MPRPALLLLMCLSGCAHLDLPPSTRPRGQFVRVNIADGSRLSGELVGQTDEAVVIGDLSSSHFNCVHRRSVVSVLLQSSQVSFPFSGLAGLGSPWSALAPLPLVTDTSSPIPSDLRDLARYADETPAAIIARCTWWPS